jgi:L-histidine N-alpha-methyltransferase
MITRGAIQFLTDTLKGLTAKEKYLSSKYFYDEIGDELFREIMACPEYYLTRCESEILSQQSDDIADAILDRFNAFDVVELGAGDCSKSVHLLRVLKERDLKFTFFPIDISANVIAHVANRVQASVPGLRVAGLNGEYFEMLDKLKMLSSRCKVVLFLGSSIGNIPRDQTVNFFKEMASHLLPGDILLTGFDLKKDPATVLAAYNDKEGITRKFNLNLLDRINKTLGANFNTALFAHKPEYDAKTGTCTSFLESIEDHVVQLDGENIYRLNTVNAYLWRYLRSTLLVRRTR